MLRCNFEGGGRGTVKYTDTVHSVMNCAKLAVPIEMQFGMQS